MQINPDDVANWPDPDYVDPETHGPVDVVVAWIVAVLITVILCIRFYTRLRLAGGIRADDFFILLAYVSNLR
jgi:hypothetical protein